MFFKDNKIFTEDEIRALNPNTSFATPFAPEGYEVIFDVPKPERTNLQTVIQDGTELDSKGNRVFKYTVKDMFADITLEDGTIKTKLEQETEYLAQLKKATVPSSITMRQARLAMIDAGIYTQVDTAIAAMTGPEGDKARVEWEYAASVERNAELLTSLATALALSEESIDDLFIAAKSL